MVRDTPSPGPRAGPSPGAKRRGPRAKSLRRTLGPSLSPFQERLKETEFYTKPLVEKFDAMSSVRVGIIKYFLLIWEGQVIHVPTFQPRYEIAITDCIMQSMMIKSPCIFQDRLLLINETLSEDTTDITRAWPLQLKTKDSR